MSPQEVSTDQSCLSCTHGRDTNSNTRGEVNLSDLGKTPHEDPTSYKLGDHVYRWISFMGVPYHTQEHAIVVELDTDSITLILVRKQESGEPEMNSELTMILERIEVQDACTTWFRIAYGVPWTKRVLSRAGTANPVDSNPVEEAINRVWFLWKNSSLLRHLKIDTTDEDDVSECIVVWCKTGNFYSYHGLAKLGHHGADIGSNATLAGNVCTQLVAGSVAPFMVPVFTIYDIAMAVQTWKTTHQCNKEWARITWEWNDKYSISKHLRQVHNIASQTQTPQGAHILADLKQ